MRKLMILAGLFMMFQFGFSNACGLRYETVKNKVYYYLDFKNKLEIKEVDYKTFEIISNTLAKDKNNVYYLGKKVSGVNSRTFKIIEEHGEQIFDCYKTFYLIEDNGNRVVLYF